MVEMLDDERTGCHQSFTEAGFDLRDLEDLLGCSEFEVYRLFKSKGRIDVPDDVYDRLVCHYGIIKIVLRMLTKTATSESDAYHKMTDWLQSPFELFGDKTPIEMMKGSAVEVELVHDVVCDLRNSIFKNELMKLYASRT